MLSRLPDLIRQRFTIVTASARLAGRLRHQYAVLRMAEGAGTWETPDILHWQAWISRCHEARQLQHKDARLLLDSIQQRCLWQEIVQASSHSRDLLQQATAVEQAMAAWELGLAWKISSATRDVFLTPDVRAWRAWADLYAKRLEREGWIDQIGLIQQLVGDPSGIEVERIVFCGFDELTPLQQDLITALRNQGNQVEILMPDPRESRVRMYAAADPRDEIRSAALWARDMLARHPQASIGVAFPNLQAVRDQVETIFDQVLHPERPVTTSALNGRHYSISVGRALSGWPLVHTAMAILGLGHQTVSINDYATLLRSPFISGSAEMDIRARFELALRDSGEQEWHADTLLRYAETRLDASVRPSQFLQRLQALTMAVQNVPSRQTPRQWAERFAGWLQAFGWPGERPLDSSEYQQFEAWQQALNGLASLGGILRRSTYATALSQLAQIISRSRFQPESAETPIQITALPGVAAMQFDYLWIAGMQDQAWPPPAQPNAFIPLALQRAAGIPSASADLMHRHTLLLTGALATSAHDLVVSYPMLDGDRECRPSPVWQSHAGAVEPFNFTDQDYARIIFQSASLEYVPDFTAPPISLDQPAGGGSGLFKDQAACGFRAFARHRLRAEGPASVNIGLDAAVRGQLVHRTLQRVWQQLGSLEKLRSNSEAALEAIITQAVTDAIRYYRPHYPESFTTRFTEIETARLQAMLREWLALERERTPFTVLGLEQKQNVNVEGLAITLRADRVDVLGDGRLVIIDYKTGSISIRQWEGDRPDDPQLPLYAVTRAAAGTEVAALAFARLKHGSYAFAGAGASENLLPGVEPTDIQWDEQLQQWRNVVHRLAREFINGQAEVDPKNELACRYCDLHSLCRVHELRAMAYEEETLLGSATD